MNGIPFFDYKVLQQHLDQVLEMPDISAFPEQLLQAREQKERLSEIYNKYTLSLQEVSELTKKFEKIKIDVRKLVMLQRKRVKQLSKKKSNAVHKPADMHISDAG